MVSDDAEHTVLVGQCLALNPPDAQSFQRMLAWKLRWWLLCAPAGIGFATLRPVEALGWISGFLERISPQVTDRPCGAPLSAPTLPRIHSELESTFALPPG